MKNYPLLLLLLLAGLSTTAQDEKELYRVFADYRNGDTCDAVVLATSGLKMRTQPGFQAKVMAVIPFETKVKYVCTDSETWEKLVLDKDGISGKWRRIFWQGKKGYAFSAYLGAGIFKMDKPFYLLTELGAWCWDDAYLSTGYAYYGVFPNSDTSVFTVKKLKPTFFQRDDGSGMGGVSFSFLQKKASWFAFATRDSFPEGPISINKSKQALYYAWQPPAGTKQKITIPHTNWEIRAKVETMPGDDGSSYTRPRLTITDKSTGAWHYLFGGEIYFNRVELNWSGDLDGDGVPDFMLSVGSDNSGGMLLFLSRNPGKWKFVKMAGAYFWGDCC